MEISIHVPAWGTTVDGTMYFLPPKFQSTFPRGERHNLTLNSSTGLYISIHVPAWGTTLTVAMLPYLSCISIHVPAWGTTMFQVPSAAARSFQSTFPRGERLERIERWKGAVIFQSTFPRGERQQKHINFPYLFTHFCIN